MSQRTFSIKGTPTQKYRNARQIHLENNSKNIRSSQKWNIREIPDLQMQTRSQQAVGKIPQK